MLYLVTYDVPDDRVRERVAAVLGRYGERVQQSVFECRIEAAALRGLQAAVARVLPEGTAGECRVYRVCTECHGASFAIGAVSAANDSAGWYLT